MQSEALRIENGRWTERMPAVWLAVSLIPLACTAVLAQTPPSPASHPSSKPAFEVATIKPADPRPHGMYVIYEADRTEVKAQTLAELLGYAYGYHVRFDGQITGLPDWGTTQRYDMVAKMTAEDAAALQKLGKDEQQRWREQAMQSLLADRFSLTLHHGTKPIPVYDLVIAKDGIKMKDAATDLAPLQTGKDSDSTPWKGIHDLKDTSVAQAYSMSSFADELSAPYAQVGRPVLDKTGLTGTYNFTLDWSIYSASAAAAGEATSIFDALRKIGLKLQPSTAAFQTIVVDHVEHPTAN